MKKGALVEILIVNHCALMIPFQTKAGEAAVEVSLPIFREYGDSVKVISATRQVAEVGTMPSAQPQSQPDIAALQQQVAQLQQMLAMITNQTQQLQPQPQQTAVNPFVNNQTVKAEDGSDVPLSMVAEAIEDDIPF